MDARERTEITVETDRILIIRRLRTVRGWCPECGCDVDLVDEAEASALTEMSGKQLPECAQAGRWHVTASQDGNGLVCLDSLLKSMG